MKRVGVNMQEVEHNNMLQSEAKCVDCLRKNVCAQFNCLYVGDESN